MIPPRVSRRENNPDRRIPSTPAVRNTPYFINTIFLTVECMPAVKR